MNNLDEYTVLIMGITLLEDVENNSNNNKMQHRSSIIVNNNNNKMQLRSSLIVINPIKSVTFSNIESNMIFATSSKFMVGHNFNVLRLNNK